MLEYLARNSLEERRKASLEKTDSCSRASEPTLFGILLPHKKLYLPVIIGGAIGGLVLGILNVGYYQFGPSNVLSVIGYISAADASNFTKGCIAAGVTFLATLLMVLFTYRKEEKQQ